MVATQQRPPPWLLLMAVQLVVVARHQAAGARAPACATPACGNLSGVHLRITAVSGVAFVNNIHDPHGNGSMALLPPAEWDGFAIDMIDWVAARAGRSPRPSRERTVWMRRSMRLQIYFNSR